LHKQFKNSTHQFSASNSKGLFRLNTPKTLGFFIIGYYYFDQKKYRFSKIQRIKFSASKKKPQLSLRLLALYPGRDLNPYDC